MSTSNALQTDLRLALLVVDVNVGDRDVGARRVRRPAELTGNHHAVDDPRRVLERANLDRSAREVARESILVEELSEITWKFSTRELSVTKPALSCTQITCHWPLRCEASKLDQNLVQVQGSKRGSGACQSGAGCADQNEGQVQKNGGGTDPGIREPVPDLRIGEK